MYTLKDVVEPQKLFNVLLEQDDSEFKISVISPTHVFYSMYEGTTLFGEHDITYINGDWFPSP